MTNVATDYLTVTSFLAEFDQYLVTSYVPIEKRVKICSYLESEFNTRISIHSNAIDWLDDGIMDYTGKLINFDCFQSESFSVQFSKIPKSREKSFGQQVIAFLKKSQYSELSDRDARTDYDI
jgi:hypothetical protein